ncbi:protein of unknown function [Luteibacter sp. 22Crub2.1]|nr:protein of unknown function [Luteibacter sp. 22Crub2.1]
MRQAAAGAAVRETGTGVACVARGPVILLAPSNHLPESRMRRCLVLALLVTACPLALAQAYKWKDAQGVTHYADTPPPNNARYEKVKTSGTVEAPAPAPAAPAKPEAAPPAPGTQVADNPANRARLCDQLRKNMDVLGKEQVISIDDGKGGSQQLDDAGKKRQIETTQAQMTLYCK